MQPYANVVLSSGKGEYARTLARDAAAPPQHPFFLWK